MRAEVPSENTMSGTREAIVRSMLVYLKILLKYFVFNMCLYVDTFDCDAISSEGYCYKYFFDASRVNREQARQECETQGYTLATVRSSDENSVMTSTATQNSNCWIGYNDINTEGTFVWDDGSTSTFTNWASGEPNQSGDEDCVHTRGDPDWNDENCGAQLNCFYCSIIGKYLLR